MISKHLPYPFGVPFNISEYSKMDLFRLPPEIRKEIYKSLSSDSINKFRSISKQTRDEIDSFIVVERIRGTKSQLDQLVPIPYLLSMEYAHNILWDRKSFFIEVKKIKGGSYWGKARVVCFVDFLLQGEGMTTDLQTLKIIGEATLHSDLTFGNSSIYVENDQLLSNVNPEVFIEDENLGIETPGIEIPEDEFLDFPYIFEDSRRSRSPNRTTIKRSIINGEIIYEVQTRFVIETLNWTNRTYHRIELDRPEGEQEWDGHFTIINDVFYRGREEDIN